MSECTGCRSSTPILLPCTGNGIRQVPNHFEAWKTKRGKMPVTVTLGGDPVYAYSSTAPLPENINEYILAGFLRKKRVKLVKCITNDLYVPEDADIVIEGYVDPEEELFRKGPSVTIPGSIPLRIITHGSALPV